MDYFQQVGCRIWSNTQIIGTMILYKHLFYFISRWVKKYDGKLWDVGDTYFIYGGMFIGLLVFVTLVTIWGFIGLFVFPPLLLLISQELFSIILKLFPIVIGVGITINLRKKRDGGKRYCDIIYDEIDNYGSKRKRRLLIFQIIHLTIVFSLFLYAVFVVSDYLSTM